MAVKGLRLLLAAALVGVAAMAAAQGGTEYLDPQVTQCWDCHAPGRWAPPMNPNFDIFPVRVVAEPGQEFTFQTQLLNTWKADQRDMFLTLDISQAPSLRFVGGEDPVLDQSVAGTIVLEPEPPGNVLDPGSNFLTQPHRAPVGIVVPDGATDLRIRLEPDQRDPNVGPDLAMRVFDARTPYSAGAEASALVDDAGRGAAEVFHVKGASEVAAHGFGNWTIEAEFTPVKASPDAPGFDPYDEIPFTVTFDVWFNATQEEQQVVNKRGPVQPGGREVFSWNVVLIGAPSEGEAIRVIADVTTHYKHDDPQNPNWDNMTSNRTAPITTLDGRAEFGFEVQDVVISPTGTVGVSMAAISEAIGYAATFLLITSIYTGGIFGKTSRRQLNTIFGSARRRVAFHNFLSYGIIAAATTHLIIFVWDTIEPNYPWQLGIIWGGTAILAMLGLGITGALQVPMIRKWNYATWRWTHFTLAITTILFTIIHMLLDGAHFGTISDRLGWEDPLVPEDRR